MEITLAHLLGYIIMATLFASILFSGIRTLRGKGNDGASALITVLLLIGIGGYVLIWIGYHVVMFLANVKLFEI